MRAHRKWTNIGRGPAIISLQKLCNKIRTAHSFRLLQIYLRALFGLGLADALARGRYSVKAMNVRSVGPGLAVRESTLIGLIK